MKFNVINTFLSTITTNKVIYFVTNEEKYRLTNRKCNTYYYICIKEKIKKWQSQLNQYLF